MQYRSRRSTFSAAMVRAKKVRYTKIFLLVWRRIFANVRVREGADFSSLLRDLTRDHRLVEKMSCHYGNEFGALIPFQLIYNNTIIVPALSEIFRKRWGAKEDGLYLSQ